METNNDAIVRRLRHLAVEFNEARRMPLKELYPVKHRLLGQANDCVREAWELGGMRSMKEFCQHPEAWERFEQSTIKSEIGFEFSERLEVELNKQREFSSLQLALVWPNAKVVYADGPTTWFPSTLFELLVGYTKVLAYCEQSWGCRISNGEVWEGQIENCRYVLKSGILSTIGFVPETEIALGRDPSFKKLGEYDIRNGSHQHSFEVLGHCAVGCKIRADYLEKEKGASSGESGAPPPSQPIDEYKTLWEYAQKSWQTKSDFFKVAESIKTGPGNYQECIDSLRPPTRNMGRSPQTKAFHSVVGALNKILRPMFSFEVFRDKEQVLIRPWSMPSIKKVSKKSANRKS